jgi:FtsZ-binding cell division protein ZapB
MNNEVSDFRKVLILDKIAKLQAEIRDCKEDIAKLNAYVIKAEGAIEALSQLYEELENENATDNRRDEEQQKEDEDNQGSVPPSE